MKIHVWGINYSPELTGIAPYNVALCEYLAERGHEVRIVTGFFYYPAWQKLATETRALFRTDRMEKVLVHRCWQYVPGRVTPLRRILHEFSFVITSFIRQLFLPRADLVIAISPPLLLGGAAWLLQRVKGTPFIFHVQDLQPDAAAGLGLLKNGMLLRALRGLERFAYAKATRVSGISIEILRAFQERGAARSKCVHFPNGVEIPDFWRLPERSKFRAAHGFSPDDFLVVYSGNVGVKQNLEALLRAAEHARDPRVKFVICGDGARREALERTAAELRLSNVRFLPLQPEARYHELLIDTDLYVIAQSNGSGRCFFPSKLLKALAFGRPVLAVADQESELGRVVNEENFGAVISPDDPRRIAEICEQLRGCPDKLQEWARAGHKWVKRYEINTVLHAFAEEIETLGNPGKAPITDRP